MSDIKQQEFAVRILAKIQELFDEGLAEEIEDNATDFIHALANMVPTSVYSTLTNTEVSTLAFNHIANRLCFQNSTLIQNGKYEKTN